MGGGRRTAGGRVSGAPELIEAFHRRWPEMLAGEIPGSVSVLAELRAMDVRLVALSNWSAETFPVARARFDFLSWFEGIVISGEVGVNKPDRRIFEQLIQQFEIEPATAVFIDDSLANIEAASGSRHPGDPIHRRGWLAARACAAWCFDEPE